jgi:S-adenosylhomocysteine hydrolase
LSKLELHCSFQEKASEKIVEKVYQDDRYDMTREEENAIFQTSFKETTGCKANRLHGHGFLSRYPTRSEVMDSKFLEQAHATAATNQKNIELEAQVQLLNEKLASEVAERERIVQEKMQAL